MRFDSYLITEDDEVEGMADFSVAIRPSVKDAKMIRKSIMEEMQAVNDYVDRAAECENDAVRKVLLDIAEEERVHFGELEMLLEAVDPIAKDTEDEGEEEVEEMFNNEDDEDEYED